jgi:tetratricopeptide (TPR) repeat protein
LKIHPNDSALEEFLLSLSEEHLGLVDHLVRCLTCRRRFLGSMRNGSGPLARKIADVLPWPGKRVDYGQIIRSHEGRLHDRSMAMAKERSDAPGLFVRLLGHAAEQRDLILASSPAFHTWGVFELLVERTLEASITSPDYAEELGHLALRLSESLDADYYGLSLIEDLRARTWAFLGNACRLRSDLQRADEAFTNAYDHLRNGTQDSLERAILLDLEASLRRDQRRFDEAEKLLKRAVSIFLQSDQRHRAGRSLVNLSTVHHYAGDPEGGIPLLFQAIGLIDPEQEPRLLLCARHNLIDDLTSSGRFLEAQGLYRATRPLYRSFPDAWSQNRRKWVKGKIARGLGQADQAESLFLAARDGFVAEGIPYDTALVSLELATLYAQQGRTGDLKRLAREMVPIFSSLNIHREALAALAYLKQSAEAERATLEVVSGVAVYLRRAQYDPALRFQEAGN